MKQVNVMNSLRVLADIKNEQVHLDERIAELCSGLKDHPLIPKLGDRLENVTWGGMNQGKKFEVTHVSSVSPKPLKNVNPIEWVFSVSASGKLIRANGTVGTRRGHAEVILT
jgi:hypothetical protein